MKIIVTGSSQGIGKGIAQEFLSHGHQVVGIDVLPASVFDDNCTHVAADVSKDNLPDLECDVLVNNAGVQNANDIDVNLKGTIRVTEKYGVQPNIKSVLFISSASAHTGAEFPEYSASKGGVIA